MDRNRGILVVGASVALLVSAGALTYWLRKRWVGDGESSEEMVEKYEEYSTVQPKPRRKPRRTSHARNGRVTNTA